MMTAFADAIGYDGLDQEKILPWLGYVDWRATLLRRAALAPPPPHGADFLDLFGCFLE